ncbi:hypothetical protein MOUN0_E06590 [Monosporozyma unispora]|nr:hypothetical protein C6P44_001229 [Kazachstania unispora]
MPVDRALLERLTKRDISLPEIEALDTENKFKEFDSEIAWKLGCSVKALAEKEFPGRGVAIDITLTTGQQLFRANSTGKGIKFDNDNWIRRKQNTVKRFGVSSFYINVKKGSLDFKTKFYCDPVEYAFHGGAIPLYLNNLESPIAILTCSGLAQEEDYILGLTAIKQFLA